MARPLKIEYKGAWYHVMNHGVTRQKIFKTEQHYKLFLQLLAEVHRHFQVEIHAYCLMPNHYHLLVRTPLPNLSDALHYLDGLYARKFNIDSKRNGPLFQDRFKSVIVDAENYLLRLSRYIHLDPVKTGLVIKPQQFQWSSYQSYLDPKSRPDYLYCEEILDRFSNYLRRKQYQQFVDEGVDKELVSFYQKTQHIPILGSDAFIRKINKKYCIKRMLHPKTGKHQGLLKAEAANIELIFQMTADFYKISFDELISSRPHKKNIAHAMGVYLSIHHAKKSLVEVVHFLERASYSSVAKSYMHFRHHLETNPESAHNLEIIGEMIVKALDDL